MRLKHTFLIRYIAFVAILFMAIKQDCQAQASYSKTLTLQEAMNLAQKNSPDAMQVEHQYRSAYWAYRSYKASLRPQLSLSLTAPSFNHTISIGSDTLGREFFVQKNSISNTAALTIQQNIAPTGGSFSISSDLNRMDNLDPLETSYASTPINFSLNQPLDGFNSFKWDKKTEPLKYEKEKKRFLSAMEDISIKTIGLFFGFATAKLNKEIADMNLRNADTLYIIGKGRYNIGTIAEDELLQLELGLINSKVAARKSAMQYQQAEAELVNFLGLPQSSAIEVVIPDTVPNVSLSHSEVLALANKNNPEVVERTIEMIESEKNLAKSKSEKGLQADLNMTYGLNQQGTDIQEAYSSPKGSQSVNFRVSIPILDWGKQKGQYRLAQSNHELTKSNIEQARLQFEQNIYNDVLNFNLQSELFLATCKSDTVAQLRYHISKQRYLIGKISTLDLNTAQKERDESRRNYMASVQEFWTIYYNVRKLTLYDFINRKELSAEFDMIIQQ